MINARQELLNVLKNIGYEPKEIKCAIIGMKSDCDDLNIGDLVLGRGCLRRALLVDGWDNEQWLSFLEGLNFNYDDGYGSQELFGVVWFKDGTWLERNEYDGSEWWKHKVAPKIPNILLNKGE